MLRNVFACLVASAAFFTTSFVLQSVADAQDPPADPADPAAPDADAEGEETPAAKATRLFKEGAGHEEAKEYDEAIAKFEEAYATVADPALYVRIGQAYQLKGNEGPDFEAIQKSIDAYKKYLELAPEGDPKIAEVVNERITVLEKALTDEEARKKQVEEDEKQQKIADAQAKQEEADREKKKKDALEGMRPALNAVIVAGLDLDTNLAARLLAGGFLGWKRFAVEGHIVFESFFPLSDDVGTSGRSLTIIDLGVRLGKGSKNFTGPFVSLGGGFGLFGGNPRERKIKDDPEQCAGFDDPATPNSCKFDIDKNITGRFGLGYGFAASKKTTVAARLDFTYWQFSVDGEQSPENVPASVVSRPQQAFSILVGLEFMRWL